MTPKHMKESILSMCREMNPDVYVKNGDSRCGGIYALWIGDKQLTEYMELSNLYYFVVGVFRHDDFMNKLVEYYK